MSDTKTLLNEIEKFLRRSSMRASTFGHKTAKDGKLVARLRKGGTVTLETANVITSFMREQIALLEEEAAKRKQRPSAAPVRAVAA